MNSLQWLTKSLYVASWGVSDMVRELCIDDDLKQQVGAGWIDCFNRTRQLLRIVDRMIGVVALAGPDSVGGNSSFLVAAWSSSCFSTV